MRETRFRSSWWQLVAVAAVAAVVRFVVALQVRTPIYYPDSYIYSSLARSIAATGLPRLRGSFIAFTPILGPVLMAPAWLIGNVDIAYRAAQAEGAVAFALAAFPAYALARRVGISERGGLAVAVLTLLVPDGVFTATMISEPYAYPLFLVVVLIGVDAMVTPTPRRQLAVVAASLALCLVRLQFAVVLAAYLAASLFVGNRSLRAYVKRQAVVLAGTGVACAALLAIGLGRVAGIYVGIEAFHYPVLGTAEWFVIAVFVVLLAAGWVVVPGAVLGVRGLAVSAPPRNRAFGFFTVFLIVGFCLEAAVFGVNEHSVLERYTFYLVPLIVIGCVWSLEVLRPERRAHAAVAYLAAAVAILLPASEALKTADVFQAPALFSLRPLGIHGQSPILLWAPVLALLAVLSAFGGAARPRTMLAVAAAVCVGTSIGASYWFVQTARVEVPRIAAPAGAAILTRSGFDRRYLMRVLFWNRAITRVVVVGEGDAPDGFPFIRAHLGPGAALVTASGVRLPGPFVVGPETLAAGIGEVGVGGPSLRMLPDRPSVVAFGWYRSLGYLAPAVQLLAVARNAALRLTIRMWSVRGTKTIDVRCSRGFTRKVDVGRRPDSIVIPVRAEARQACRFSLVRGSVVAVGGQNVSVRAALTVAYAG